mmetsp:Transcript_35442/g.70062  ORF Transcript_35442/g.70062 Transcript_35442/m.70062 type:complete len:221 (-) Transcript_35442:142-804(-)
MYSQPVLPRSSDQPASVLPDSCRMHSQPATTGSHHHSSGTQGQQLACRLARAPQNEPSGIVPNLVPPMNATATMMLCLARAEDQWHSIQNVQVKAVRTSNVQPQGNRPGPTTEGVRLFRKNSFQQRAQKLSVGPEPAPAHNCYRQALLHTPMLQVSLFALFRANMCQGRHSTTHAYPRHLAAAPCATETSVASQSFPQCCSPYQQRETTSHSVHVSFRAE